MTTEWAISSKYCEFFS